MTSKWTVHKFGGSSLASADLYQRVALLVEERSHERRAVVVSAMGGVTNQLIELVRLTTLRDAGYHQLLAAVQEKQLLTIAALLPRREATALTEKVARDFRDIEDLLRGLWLMGTAPEAAVELISGYGELWSAQVLAALLKTKDIAAEWLDAREVLVIENGELGPVIDWDESGRRLRERLATESADVLVITGFIATSREGTPTTLGRNGSDFAASIFGALLEAEAIHIWTDVDGVMSADPRQVPEAQVVPEVSYQEAMELAYFGAKVIHPNTMAPAVKNQIPIFIRNTFNPDFPGTRIHLGQDSATAIKGFATISNLALVNVEGTGMIGVPGIAHRLFGTLREARVSVIMISQASSEHSICFAVPFGQAEAAQKAVERGFFAELHHGQVQTVEVSDPCSILAIVGDKMAGTPGLAAKLFTALGKAGVNVRAIAQGSSERNISVVIDQKDTTKALRAAHSGFYLSNQTLSVGIIGPGNVGGTLLDQLAKQAERLKSERKIDIRVRAITGASKMVLDEAMVDLKDWRSLLEEGAVDADMDRFVDHVQTDYHPHAVIIDCTASEAISSHYQGWLSRGIHVVTPNKKANTASFEGYQELRKASRTRRRHYLYETTVGAGLPIIQTLRDLIETGDRVLKIEGILSGTLSYLFNAYDGERPFSELLRDAHRLGYTEPDPRDDLSGMDVARKVVILGREMGLTLELGSVEVESLVPESLRAASVEEFMEGLSKYDDEMKSLLISARESHQVLRFVGSVDRDGRASVKLEKYDQSHAFARIKLTDNIVQFQTERYFENPLVVQGPGAGPDVTAGGIFADLLRLAAYVGASQ